MKKKNPLYHAFGYSVALHLSLLVIAILFFALSPSRKPADNYIVTLVALPGGSAVAPSQTPAPVAEQTKSQAPLQKKADQVPAVQKKTKQEKTKQEKREDEELLSDRVAALKAKKRIERMVAERRLADVSAAKQSGQATAAAKAGKGGKPGGGDYSAVVSSIIHQNWIYPESIDKSLEALVLIKVRRDGSIQIVGVEKSSGSPLFDRSGLRAINKSTPLPRPPQETEILVRFTP
ncbi:MAG TPA: TonB family protein [Dissulfurispiraceae bacterium]|nr:TonB family protein [Dissulfurispiraceae bacterium]